MDIYTSNNKVMLFFTHSLLHPGCPNNTRTYTSMQSLCSPLSPSRASHRPPPPAFSFSSQTNRTASRVSQRPLFVPAKSPFHAGDTRFATTARFSCTRTHDRQERIHSSQPHRCRHVADRSFSKRTHINRPAVRQNYCKHQTFFLPQPCQ